MNGPLKMLFLLALLSAVPPLSTDMYLPAMPLLQKTWHESQTMLNFTLSSFLVGFCFSMLLYGPLSDRYGRKPPLIIGIGVFTLASFLSGFVNGIHSLIALRALQGIGAAGSMVIAMAITKDRFTGSERQRILAYMGVIIALAPMSAPVLGGFLMTWFTWHWIFFAQAVLGIVSLTGVLLMEEPLKQKSEGNLLAAMGMYLQLLHNRRYVSMVLLFSLIVWAPFSFIGSAKDIYITQFGLSPQRFGYFFAFNAIALMLGSFTCSQTQKMLSPERMMTISFFGMFVGGILLHLGLIDGPWGFAAPMGVISFFFGFGRPSSNHLVLEQVDYGVGAASSLMVFFFFILGAIATWLISLDWSDTVLIIARFAIVTNLIAFIGGLILFGGKNKVSASV